MQTLPGNEDQVHIFYKYKKYKGNYNFKWTGKLNSINMVAKKLLVNIPRKNRWTFKALGGPEILPTEVNDRLQEEQA